MAYDLSGGFTARGGLGVIPGAATPPLTDSWGGAVPELLSAIAAQWPALAALGCLAVLDVAACGSVATARTSARAAGNEPSQRRSTWCRSREARRRGRAPGRGAGSATAPLELRHGR